MSEDDAAGLSRRLPLDGALRVRVGGMPLLELVEQIAVRGLLPEREGNAPVFAGAVLPAAPELALLLDHVRLAGKRAVGVRLEDSRAFGSGKVAASLRRAGII